MDYSTKMSKMKRERGIQIEEKPEVVRLRRRSPEESIALMSLEIVKLQTALRDALIGHPDDCPCNGCKLAFRRDDNGKA